MSRNGALGIMIGAAVGALFLVPAQAAPQESMPAVDAMTKTASGLFLRDDVVGTGEPAVLGDEVTLTDTAWLLDGERVHRLENYVVTLGVTPLVQGFTEGLVGIRVGGTRTIVIPADLAYGSQRVGRVPANAVLVLEILVTGIRHPR